MDRSEWLAARKTGIGSSDAAAVCGLSPYRSALEVYLDKTGQLADREPSAPMRWGLRLETAIAAAYEEETGRRLESAPAILRHDDHPWMLASIDRLATEDGRIVELKTARAALSATNVYIGPSMDWGPAGTDQVPEGYLIQVHHQMAVSGIDRADVAVLIGGQDFRVYELARNERLVANLLEIEAAFWQQVLDRRPPDPAWSHPSTPELIRAMYKVAEGQEVTLGEEAVSLAETYRVFGERAKAAGEVRDVAKAKLLHLMQHAALGHLPDGRTLTRKMVTRREHTVKGCSYVDFHIRERKGART